MVILYPDRFFTESIFFIISSDSIATLPSLSHSFAAAKDPMMLDTIKDCDFTKDRDEYANNASPVPVVSTILFVNDGKANALVLSLAFLSFLLFLFTETKPLSPSFKIKFLNLVLNASCLDKLLILES